MKALGVAGERLAARELETVGLTILERNWRSREGEIDIIALDPTDNEPELVFCEVKTRRSRAWGDPVEAVDGRKQGRIRRVAAAFLRERGRTLPALPCRFDVVEVLVERGAAHVNHVRDAF